MPAPAWIHSAPPRPASPRRRSAPGKPPGTASRRYITGTNTANKQQNTLAALECVAGCRSARCRYCLHCCSQANTQARARHGGLGMAVEILGGEQVELSTVMASAQPGPALLIPLTVLPSGSSLPPGPTERLALESTPILRGHGK